MYNIKVSDHQGNSLEYKNYAMANFDHGVLYARKELPPDDGRSWNYDLRIMVASGHIIVEKAS